MNLSGSRKWLATALVGVTLLLGGGRHARGQPAAETPVKQDEITVEVIEARRKQAEESKDLDEETKKKVLELYRQASAELQQAADFAAKAAQFKTAADNVQQRLETIKTQIAELKQKPEPPPPAAMTLPELEQALAKQQVRVNELKGAQVKSEAEPKSRATRRKDIRSLLFSAPERLAQVKTQRESAAPAGEAPLLTLARQTELLARQKAIQQEIPALQNELAMFDAEDASDLLRQDRDLQTLLLARAEKEYKLFDDQVKEKRAEEARTAVVRAQEEAIRAQPLLKPFAERNQMLAQETQRLTAVIEQVDVDLSAAKRRYEDLEKQFVQTKEKVDSVGLTGAIGVLLRKQGMALPDLRRRRWNVGQRREIIDDTQFALFEYDEERSNLADLDPIVNEVLSQAPAGLTDDQREQLEQATRTVLSRKRDYLDALIRSYNTYFDTLVDLDTTEQQLIKLTEQYSNYIHERVLWTRSGKPLYSEFDLDESDLWTLSPLRWQRVITALGTDVRHSPIVFAAALLFFGAMFYWRKRFRQEIGEIGEQAQRSTFYRFLPTLRAVLLTIIIASLWPGVLAYLSWRLAWVADGDDFLKGLAYGFRVTATVFFPLEIVRQVCRPLGLAEAHFDWPESAIHLLRRSIRLLLIMVLPLVLASSTLLAASPEQAGDSVERILFILEMVVVTWFLRRVLRPVGGVFQTYIGYHQGGWIDRLKYVWYWIGALAPLGAAVLAFSGYYYTARQLFFRLAATVGLIVLLAIVRALLLRLVQIQRRKLSIEQARQRRAANTAAAESAPGTESTLGPHKIVRPEEQRIDLSHHSNQAQQLFTAGLLAVGLIGVWLIWVDVLPAVGILDRWPLWTTSVQVTETITSPSGEDETRTRNVIQTVTFSDVALAALIAVFTFITTRNLPGLLEISLLRRLPIDASVRYAMTTLASYGIVALGVILACTTIGLRWSQIQWLVTALTFGLAFGLQEMFANFVAGLIILFERPIRVGDVVTVDEVTGVISRIRIRATTITNWDRKEFIVPNKEFITGRLLNWTLSDSVNRIVINVGIAYGSDTELAKELLLKVAREHPLTLEDPPSMATFEGFGDSCLNFTLRTFLPNLENRLPVIHELYTAIDRAFREAHVEIAFPQRDLHIRTLPKSLPAYGSSNGNATGEAAKSASESAK